MKKESWFKKTNIEEMCGVSWPEVWHRRFCAIRGHDWQEYQDNSAKRICSKCGRIEWMFTLPYYSVTEPSIQWKEML